jgi:uncharacterized repeat protein (TIGR01451 family)
MDVKLVGTVAASPAGATVEADLLASTLEPAGSTYGADGTVVAETGTPAIDVADTVYVDEAASGNLAATDVFEDGQHSDNTTADVQPVLVTIAKSVRVIDRAPGADCATAPQVVIAEQFAIPGACIEYTITVSNTSAGTAATNVAISDPLPGQITFAAFHSSTSTFDAGPLESGGTVSATKTTLGAGTSVSLVVRAIIN